MPRLKMITAQLAATSRIASNVKEINGKCSYTSAADDFLGYSLTKLGKLLRFPAKGVFMPASLNIVIGEINELVKALAAADNKAMRLVKQYRAAKREKIAINEKIDLLRSLAEKIKSVDGDEPPPDEPTSEVQHPTSISIRGGTTSAVMKALKAAERPMRGSELAARLNGKLETTAKNPTRLIQSTLINLKNRGLLIQDLHGRYLPNPNVIELIDYDDVN